MDMEIPTKTTQTEGTMKHNITLANGAVVPALGQGTWYLGEQRNHRQQEIEGIRKGVEAGMTLIDTAEMYGNGAAEDMLGEALSTLDRSKLFSYRRCFRVMPAAAGCALHWRAVSPGWA